MGCLARSRGQGGSLLRNCLSLIRSELGVAQARRRGGKRQLIEQAGVHVQEAVAPAVRESLRRNTSWLNLKGVEAGYPQTGTLLHPCLGLVL